MIERGATCHRLHQSGKLATPAAYALLLRSCGTPKTLQNGKHAHEHIVKCGLEQNRFLASLLVQMYDNCGAFGDALQVFANMRERNVFSWNHVLKVYAHQGKWERIIELFDRMQQEGVVPNKVTILCTVSAYNSQAALTEGKKIHARIIASELELDVVLETALLHMYSKCSSLNDANKVFNTMTERNVFSWTAMIGAYTQVGQDKEALQLFEQMQQEGVLPNKVTFLSILAMCTNKSILVEGERIHLRILHGGIELDVVVGTALVTMYGKCGRLQNSENIFERLPDRSVVSWNSMIAVYSAYGLVKQAVQLFVQMQLDGVLPDKVTFLNLLPSCASKASTNEGKLIHAALLNSDYEQDTVVRNALVNMYGNCGSLEDARAVFYKLPDPDLVSWTTMISVCTENGQSKEAFQLFEQMQVMGVAANRVTYVILLRACANLIDLAQGKRMHVHILHSKVEQDVVIENALVHMYGTCSSLETAERMFYHMLERDVVSWNIMMVLYCEHGKHEESLQLFNEMQQEGMVADEVTFVSALTACANLAALAEGEQIHKRILDCGYESDIIVANSLISMYGKCGKLEKARGIFDELHERTVVSWSSMIAVYAQHGQGKEALWLFDQMKQAGIAPEDVTFLNVLVACSHAGLVKEGYRCFQSMKQAHGILPAMEHYVCMIDLFGRAGQLDDAEYLMNNMPFPPNVMSFMALLGACRYQADVERGERAAKRVFELDRENTAPCMVLSTIYAVAGREDDTVKVNNMIKERGLKQESGCSLIKVNGRVHKLLADDDSHP